MPHYKPFNDGIKDPKLRSRLRREAWGTCRRIKHSRWTEKRCNECGAWNHRDKPDEWCEHFKQPPTEANGPTVQVFTPYFNPNAQPGGVWLETAAQERECMKLNGKEWKH